MLYVLTIFFRLCLLSKANPSALPASLSLVLFVLLANLGVQYFSLTANDNLIISSQLAAGWAVVMAAISAGSLLALLGIAHKANRFIQTLTALLGCNTLLTLPQFLFAAYLQDVEQFDVLTSVVAIASAALQIYHLLVLGSILQQAFETTWVRGCLLVMLTVILSIVGAGLVLPLPEILLMNAPQ